MTFRRRALFVFCATSSAGFAAFGVACSSSALDSAAADGGSTSTTNAGDAGSSASSDATTALDSATSDPDSSVVSTGGDDDDGDASADATVPPVDAGPPPVLVACPTDPSADDAGVQAFDVPGDLCYSFTPVQTGEPATGENAAFPHYALRSATAVPTSLVLFFIGSGGHPSGALKSDPATNLYAAAVADGRAVLGLSYKNVASVGSICLRNDPCYFPTRESIILGTTEADSGITVSPDEGIVDRTAKALRYLAAGDPGGGWGSFLTTLDPTADPVKAIVWSKIIAAGHSQGGGHAAAIGKLFPVLRVVQFSSTCDSNGTGAVSWTNGAAGTWATNPAQFYGFGAPSVDNGDGTFSGDSTCPYHTENWTNLGMRGAYRDNNAEICGDTGDTHGESIRCTDNYAEWVHLFE